MCCKISTRWPYCKDRQVPSLQKGAFGAVVRRGLGRRRGDGWSVARSVVCVFLRRVVHAEQMCR